MQRRKFLQYAGASAVTGAAAGIAGCGGKDADTQTSVGPANNAKTYDWKMVTTWP